MATTQRAPPIVRNRLPTLVEVLRRNTKPPVDLYCYYLFLQQESCEDTLDFWLDVQSHENLCRAYFKDLGKTGISVRDDWPRYHEYARTRGSIYGNWTGVRRGDDGGEQVVDEDAERYRSESPLPPSLNEKYDREIAGQFDSNAHHGGGGLQADREAARYAQRTPSPNPDFHPHGSTGAYPLSPTLRAMYPHDDEIRTGTIGRRTSSATPAVQPFIKRESPINRTDLIASAERIYSRYLMPGADKEVYLPPALRIHEFPLSSSTLPAVTHPDYDREADAQAQVPDMFHAQKEFVYRAMEQDTFPRFLRAKAFTNLTPMSSLTRLGFGLLALWIALATAFSFIFLDSKPRIKRLWIILPFTVAIINLVASQYDVDPLLVFMGLSETRPFHTIGIREPYVRKLLFGRALWVTFVSAILVAVITVIFTVVPGHRL